MRKGEYVYLFLFLASTVVMAYLGTTLDVGYYGKTDLLGPISKFPVILLPLAVTIGLAAAYAFRHGSYGRGSLLHWLILTSPIVLLILYLLFLPDSIEKYVFTNYYDVIGHMARANYVLATGRSNISVDPYFELQPAVFYATAALMMVTGMEPYVIYKWFPFLFVVVVYVPSLLFLGKSFFENRRELALFVFLSLATMWVPTRYHYSAQVYALPLYNILVALLVRRAFNRGGLITIFVICTATIPTHQGVSLFVMATFVSVLLLVGLEKPAFRRTERGETLLRLTILFSVIWLGYLSLLTAYTFRSFVEALKEASTIILSEEFFRIFSGALTRSDQTYQLLVYGKMLTAATVYLFSFPVLAYCWFKKGMKKLGTVVMIVLGVSATIFVLGFSFGGAGFVERAVLMIGPLLAVGLTITASRMGKMNSPLPIVTMLVLLTVTGGLLFNSSRNFQSITFSEQACDQFAISHNPSQTLGYYGTAATVARYSYQKVADIDKTPTGIFIQFRSYLIESSYWVPEDVLANATARPNEMSNFIRFYSNGISQMYLAR